MSYEEKLLAVIEKCRFALEPYDDIKPRDWKTDRERLAFAHQYCVSVLSEAKESIVVEDDLYYLNKIMLSELSDVWIVVDNSSPGSLYHGVFSSQADAEKEATDLGWPKSPHIQVIKSVMAV